MQQIHYNTHSTSQWSKALSIFQRLEQCPLKRYAPETNRMDRSGGLRVWTISRINTVPGEASTAYLENVKSVEAIEVIRNTYLAALAVKATDKLCQFCAKSHLNITNCTFNNCSQFIGSLFLCVRTENQASLS